MYSATVLSLPSNDYRFVIGQSFNILYVRDTSDVFKIGNCIDMSIMVYGVCVDYDCYDSNCQSCLLSEQFCTDCSAGWISNDNRKCDVDLNYTNSSLGNTTNLPTVNISTTNSSNVTDPSITNTSAANSTNATDVNMTDPTANGNTTQNNTDNSSFPNATSSNSSTPTDSSNSTSSNATNSTSSNSTIWNQTSISSNFS